ncbi:MAG: hypothetical protein Kow0090_22970 [Myxococcota bacterium]
MQRIRFLLSATLFFSILAIGAAANELKIAFTKGETTIYEQPFERAKALYTVKKGKALRVLDERDDWLRVQRLKSHIGWVKKSDVDFLKISRKKQKRIEKRAGHFAADEVKLSLDMKLMVGDKGVLNETMYLYSAPSKKASRKHRFVKDFEVRVVAEKGNWIEVSDEIGRRGWTPKNYYTSLRPPPEVNLEGGKGERDESHCRSYYEAVCDCYGEGSGECLRTVSETKDALSKDKDVALELCEEKLAIFTCVQTEMLVSYNLDKCADVQNKDFQPLKFKAGECKRGKNSFEVKSLWGSSDEVLPGETFIAEGVYNYGGDESALIEFGPNGGSSRPCRQEVKKGGGKFAVAALVVYAEDEEANELQLALIRGDDSSTALAPLACAIKIEKKR